MTQIEAKRLNSILDDGNGTLLARVGDSYEKVVEISEDFGFILTNLRKMTFSHFKMSDFFVANSASDYIDED